MNRQWYTIGDYPKLGLTYSDTVRNKDDLGMDDDGYLSIMSLLQTKAVNKVNANFEDIVAGAEIDKKKRFQIKIDPPSDEITIENGYIRAVQGHSLRVVKESKLLSNLTFPYKYPVIVHGTYKTNMEPIKLKGLCKMERNHVHLAKGYIGDDDVISGMREDGEIFFELNVGKMIKDGMILYESSNGVILSSGKGGYIKPKYFSAIKNKKGRILLCPKFRYLVITELNNNYQRGMNKSLAPEITEISSSIIDVFSNNLTRAFHTYVIPNNSTSNSTKISNLNSTNVPDKNETGINLKTALLKFHSFLNSSDVLGTDFMLVTFNSKNYRNLQREVKQKKIFLPSYFKQWIDFKRFFPILKYAPGRYESKVIRTIEDVMAKGDVKAVRKWDNGLDSCIELAKGTLRTLKDKIEYDMTKAEVHNYDSASYKVDDFEKQVQNENVQGISLEEIE